MSQIAREQILFWWSPTLSELRRCWPALSMNDAVAAIENNEYVLGVIDTDPMEVWIMRP